MHPVFSDPKFRELLISHGGKPDFVSNLIRRIENLNEKIAKDTANLGPGYCIGHSYFCALPKGVAPDESWYKRIIKTEVGPLIKEYWFDNATLANSLIDELLQ